ncbi:hypothetical protein ASH00_04655 [Arthrobacter sp. Soil782]|uniref:ATP-dependent DNA ligase n=1 Tax=Arthrobacter sp. Soil782 TaxID=1736410 RepID=UPI0006FB9A9B|nr:hypothetical protein [Arthrobacter sp. Soil782]KRF08969.1 hypothetical protein ASH00_04655 [Arthrobacter sp. Soil782]
MAHASALAGRSEHPVSAFRVAKESYGPLNPQERGLLSGDRSTWYRFDTPGRTIYTAEDPTTVFLEALSWPRMTASHDAYPRKAAAFFGEPVETIRQEVEEPWRANGHMIPGCIPANWRDGRLLYSLQFEARPWVDIAHSETFAALNGALPPAPGAAPWHCPAKRGSPKHRKARAHRIAIVHTEEEASLWSRQGKDLTRYFPDLPAATEDQIPPGFIIDGEAVIWTDDRLDSEALQTAWTPAVWRYVIGQVHRPAGPTIPVVPLSSSPG